ncbi:rhodanese-like domain-containing protein [Flavobacteriaceae bacterium R33]|uniref:Rhodanese-like domain-containing protein n=2 Tax=Poritiphilus flavus TaxID=2697053 RepID=A0A6L9EDL6_9FLAO|nr:rhodanese-like domain-containing protein [Poritiphilus flavus]
MYFRLRLIVLLLGIFITGVSGQETIKETLETLNKNSIPYISVEELAKIDEPVLLDTRSKEEFRVSRLKNAIWVGYEDFKAGRVSRKIKDKKKELIVYCSVGVRSEVIGDTLKVLGYENVRNLYGGIFEWKNKELPVYDRKGMQTEKVHAFDEYWGKLLKKGEKVYPD